MDQLERNNFYGDFRTLWNSSVRHAALELSSAARRAAHTKLVYCIFSLSVRRVIDSREDDQSVDHCGDIERNTAIRVNPVVGLHRPESLNRPR